MPSLGAIIPPVPLATRSAGPWPAAAWQDQLRQAVADVGVLLRELDISPADVNAAASAFPVKVPRPYLTRMRRGDAKDPLLRQVLPTAAELSDVAGYTRDPLLEASATVAPGLLQKYAGRALLIATGACAVHCRYCFRRHFPYSHHRQLADALNRVAQEPDTRELILSGGDPLLLADGGLARLLARIGEMAHVTRLRLHTRLPVVIPQRVTAALIDALANVPQRVVVVLHFNHPNEIDGDCRRALAALGRFVLLNQSVLLAGVNDDAEVLAKLSEELFEAGVLPYYLHLPDAVAGTAHFDVPTARAIAIHHELGAALPGYLVPRLVRETPGAVAKEQVLGEPAPREPSETSE